MHNSKYGHYSKKITPTNTGSQVCNKLHGKKQHTMLVVYAKWFLQICVYFAIMDPKH